MIGTEQTGSCRSEFSSRSNRLVRTLHLAGTSHEAWIDLPSTHEGDPLGTWWQAYLSGAQPESDATRPRVRTVEMFCGPGGLALGARQACKELGLSFESRVAIDQDAAALDLYRLNHSTELAVAQSVTSLVECPPIVSTEDGAHYEYEPEILEPDLAEMAGGLDLLLAGPPCQGHSNLNNKTRRNDPRNKLYLTVPAFAIAADIPMVVIENVTAVVHDTMNVVNTTVQLLEHHGYSVSGGVLRANQLGWPQTRARYFLVARRGAPPIPLGDIAEGLADEEARSVMWAIEDLIGIEPDEGMNRQPKMNKDNNRRVDWLHDNDEFELALEERPDCHKDGTTYKAVYGRMYPDKPAPTLTTGFMTPGRGRFVHPTERRVLTPREAARIQGFPDDYRWRLPRQPEPKSQLLAKWIGDAVPMPLGHAAALSVLGPELAA